MDLYREVSRGNLKKDLEHVRRYLLQLTAAHVCPRNDVIFHLHPMFIAFIRRPMAAERI